MNSTVDGEFQKYAVESGDYIREHFFGPDPRLRRMVEHLSDDDLRTLPRGGHDYRKLYAAYKMAVEHEGSPTVILAKTIKGWTLGSRHRVAQRDAPDQEAHRRRAQGVPRPSAAADPRRRARRRRPAVLAPGHRLARVRVHDGAAPRARRPGARAGRAHEDARRCRRDDAYADVLAGTGEKVQASTTTAFARLLRNLLRDPGIGTRVVPIIPDEARTFGLDALFRDYKIYAPFGQALRARRRRAAALVPRGAATGGSSRRGSPRPARWRRSPPPAPRTPRGASR